MTEVSIIGVDLAKQVFQLSAEPGLALGASGGHKSPDWLQKRPVSYGGSPAVVADNTLNRPPVLAAALSDGQWPPPPTGSKYIHERHCLDK